MADRPLGRAQTLELLTRHGVRPTKALGQNFLVDPNIIRKIVAEAGLGPDDRVVEVGAGLGTLTRALASAVDQVVAYEVDERLRPILEECLAGTDVEVRFVDAARQPPHPPQPGWALVANLPYNVGTPLLLELLTDEPHFDRFVVMLQREAVDRLAADPGSKVYGLPSVVAQLHGEVRVAFRVAPSVFYPVPRVESAVAIIERKPAAPHTEAAIALAGRAFGQRRKMLRTSIGLDGEVFAVAGIDAQARAENLSPDDYLLLARAVADAA